jgi:UDP-N-acetylmuramate dehydrogenase
MDFFKNEPLFSRTTMRLGGPAKYLCTITNEQDLLNATIFAKQNNLKIITIGGGSNIIFGDNGFDGLVIVNQIMGVNIDKISNILIAGAGENWDDVVKASVEANLSGIECLSLIPGTVGGAPVNNIGAYGQEIKDTLLSIRALDTATNNFVNLNNQDCQFGYRQSIFKSSRHGRYVITAVSLKLNNDSGLVVPNYASLQTALNTNNITSPTLLDIRNTVINIRNSKLPDPKIIANTGSFFKNPIVTNQKRDELFKIYPNLVYFDYNGQTKLAAGWLIDNAGLKGYKLDGIKVYEKQALVLVNEGTRSAKALFRMVAHIKSVILHKYGVDLQTEPEIFNEDN